MLTSNKVRATVKQELEAELRGYVVRQMNAQPNYLITVVSPNAHKGFRNRKYPEKQMNEIVAEVLLQKDKGTVKDPYLLEKVEGMFK